MNYAAQKKIAQRIFVSEVEVTRASGSNPVPAVKMEVPPPPYRRLGPFNQWPHASLSGPTLRNELILSAACLALHLAFLPMAPSSPLPDPTLQNPNVFLLRSVICL